MSGMELWWLGQSGFRLRDPSGGPVIFVDPFLSPHVDVSDAYTFGEQISGGLVRYLGYVIELGGVCVYHAGDCIPYEGHATIVAAFQPDLALLPINGRDFYRETERNLVGNMDFREAVRLALAVGAQALVPMHWELLPHNLAFPGDLMAYAAQHCPEITVITFGRGRRLIYSVSQMEE